MTTGVLTQDVKESKVFGVIGECHICAVGNGTISIQRRLGKTFETMTNERGEEMTFVGDGVLFNSKIEGVGRTAHRLVAETTDKITFTIVGGKTV